MLRPPLRAAALIIAVLLPGAGACDAVAAVGAAAAGAPVATKLEWSRFTDPAEQAFTLDVPPGWTVRGGIYRLGYSDARLMVDMTSPEGSLNVRLGDVAVPSYVLPSQIHARESEIYDLGAQARMVVARYRPGPEFAVLYSHARFYQLCQDPRSDAGESGLVVPDYLPVSMTPNRTSSGEIAYRCTAGHKVAFAFARTSLYQTIWGANTLGSFLAPADQVPRARAILLHCAESLQLSRQWLEYQKQMDEQGLAYQRARQQQRMAQLAQQVQQFEARMRAMSQQVESFTNVLNGIAPTVDPLTGQSRVVWTGPKERYWTNGTGDVINSNTPPGPSWHEIIPNR